MSRAIVLHATDNVGTLIDAGNAGDVCVLQGERSSEITLLEDIPFGHKMCLQATPKGEKIIKYGQVIGHASRSLKVGEHVHVHNVESARGRGDEAKR